MSEQERKINAHAVCDVARELLYSYCTSKEAHSMTPANLFGQCLRLAEVVVKMQTEYVNDAATTRE